MKSLLSPRISRQALCRCACEYSSSRRWCKPIQEWIKQLSCILPPLDLTVILVGPGPIAQWNQQYRGHKGATTVLSFLLSDRPVRVVEVYLCIPEIRRRLTGTQSFPRELQKLLVHGILHSLGEDHQNDMQEARMERKAKQYLKLLVS